MVPKVSFWNWFKAEGRLKNEWAHALKDANQKQRLYRLREILKKLSEKPAQYSYLWMPFLECFLGDDNVQLVNEADFGILEEMGNVFQRESLAHEDRLSFWFRIIKAYDIQGKKLKANSLLRRAYRASVNDGKTQSKICYELARRQAKGDKDLAIYVEYLHHSKEYTKETIIINLLTKICRVDFDSDNVLLRRAAYLAKRLQQSHIKLDGVLTSQGIYALQVENSPSKAIRFFTAAIHRKSTLSLAWLGLISALIQNGDYNKVTDVTQKLSHQVDAKITGLITFNKILLWLDSYSIAGLPPATVEDLGSLELRKYVGDVVDNVFGRLHLLEGSASKAAELLLPLVDKYQNEPRLIYYAAWAAILSDNHEGLERLVTMSKKWSLRWIIGLLVMDYLPALVKKHDISKYTQSNSSISKSIIRNHLEIANSGSPHKTKWKPGCGSLEENLEALRTSLGFGYYARDESYLNDVSSTPLFHRLPLAEQTMWMGLCSLVKGDTSQSKELLQKAADRFGNKRAALILTTVLLQENKISEANHYLNICESALRGNKTKLIRAYIESCIGNVDEAVEQLEQLISLGESRAQYSLGNVYLDIAEKAQQAGKFDKAQLYLKQASSAFFNALQRKQKSPIDCKALMLCTRFITEPDQQMKPMSEIFDEVLGLTHTPRNMWIRWHVVISQLWQDPLVNPSVLCEEITSLLEDIECIPEQVATPVAKVAAKACIESSVMDQASSFVKLLGFLASRCKSPAVRYYHQLGIAVVMRIKYSDADRTNKEQILQNILQMIQKDGSNDTLTLLFVLASLENEDNERASLVLQDVRSENELNQQVITSLCYLLNRNSPECVKMPNVPEKISSDMKEALHLLWAVVAFTAEQREEGYENLLAAIRIRPNGLIKVVDIEQFLPPLCIRIRKGSVIPPYLLESIRRMLNTREGDKHIPTLVRCAIAVGLKEDTCRIMEELVKKNPTSDVLHDFIQVLCHYSVEEYNSKQYSKTVALLQKASEYAKTG